MVLKNEGSSTVYIVGPPVLRIDQKSRDNHINVNNFSSEQRVVCLVDDMSCKNKCQDCMAKEPCQQRIYIYIFLNTNCYVAYYREL